MNCLLVFCHPSGESYNAALAAAARDAMAAAGHEVRLVDLYRDRFEPVMGLEEWRNYHTAELNKRPVPDEVADLDWAEMLVFVYPTWWFGLPAMLKGWLDRVILPHVAFDIPTETRQARGKLHNIRRVAVITTCGASWLKSKLVGEPGRKTLLRSFRILCHPRCRTLYLALYNMDTVSLQKRQAHLEKVSRRLARFGS